MMKNKKNKKISYRDLISQQSKKYDLAILIFVCFNCPD